MASAGQRPAEAAAGEPRRLPLPRRARRRALRRQGEVAAAARAPVLPGRAQRRRGSGSTSSSSASPTSRRSSPRNEVEALHLEQSLVKRHRPPFNVRLRDDKSFPYIAVTVEDDYPRVMFTRERHRRGVVYFGPYANAKKVRETLDVLNRVFRYRPCEGPQPGRHSGIPCLDFHIERCFAPCVGYISKEDYAADHRRRDRVPLGRRPADQARARAADARGGGRGALRGRRALPQPAARGRAPRRAAGGRAARRSGRST